MAQVNRYLKDKAMDHIDHALGRPLNPMAETYRNHFATDCAAHIAAFSASPHWIAGKAHDGMQFFRVSHEGRAALHDHLRAIGDPHRAYTVRHHGYEQQVIATSPGKARYNYWLDVSDCNPDLTFAAFCRAASVTVTHPKRRAA